MIKFIDLFAGIGGFRLALEELGAKCVFSSEIDKFCQQTYQANFGAKPPGDITKIDLHNIPQFDLLCAGFPCQSFSIAGKRKGFDDPRGILINNVYEILKMHQPKAFLLENVKGLVSHNKGETFKEIIKSLINCGYAVTYTVLKASDYGLPQIRPRLYIVGLKDAESMYKFEFPQPILLTKNVGSILEENVDPKYTLSDKLWTWHKYHKEKESSKKNGFGYRLYSHEDTNTGTLTARYGKDGKEILIEQENNNPRKLTPRECARLMGFPDSFKIIVSDNQAYKQFGNSVAVPVIKAIGEQLLKVINSGRS